MREKHGQRFWIISLITVFATHGVLMFVVSLPLQLGSAIEGRAAGVVQGLGRIAPELFPGVRFANARVVSESPEVAVGEISCAPGGAEFVGAAMCFKDGQHGVLYAIASAAESWAGGEAVMKEVLGRFFYSGRGAQAAGPAAPAMATWRDPVEGAFTCPAPKAGRSREV